MREMQVYSFKEDLIPRRKMVYMCRRYYRNMAAWSLPLYVGCFRDIEEPFHYDDLRFPQEYQWDGGHFDRFGNNQTRNLQFKGRCFRCMDPSSSIPTTWLPRGRYWEDIEIAPIMMSGGIPIYVLNAHTRVENFSHVPWSYGWEYFQYRSWFRVGALGQYAVGYAEASFHFQPGFKEPGLSWSTSISGGTCTPIDTTYYKQAIKDDLKSLGDSFEEFFKHLDTIRRVLRQWCRVAEAACKRQAAEQVASGGTMTNSWSSDYWHEPVHVVGEPNLDKISKLLPWSDVSLAGFTADELSIHAREVIESYNDFSSNLIAYAADLRKVGDTARSVLKLSRNWKNPKAWAEAWLSGRYGDRLAIQDTKELFESLSRRLGTRMAYTLGRARVSKDLTIKGHPAHIDRTSTLIAENESYNELMTAINNLMRWDAWPTLENTWDMIPLSFVVDWALPVSDLLGQIDAAIQAPYIKPISSYVGDKVRLPIIVKTDDGDVCQGEITFYERIPHSILSDVRPFTVESTLPSFSVVNAGDALALVTTLRGHR